MYKVIPPMLHPLTKFMLLLCFSIGSMLFTDPRYTFPIALAATFFYIVASLSSRLRGFPRGRAVHVLVFVGAIALVGFNAAFASVNIESRRVLFVIPFWGQGYPVSKDGILFGIGAGLRYVTMFFALVGFLVSTVPRDFSNALEDCGCPITISSVFALTFRFLATLNQVVSRHWEGQKSRGFIRSRQTNVSLWIIYGTLLKNVFVNIISMAPRYSLALEIRGLGTVRMRTHLRAYRLTWRDIVVLTATVAALSGAVYIRVFLRLGTFKPA